MAGRSNCWPVPNASRAAGGMARMPGATTTWRAMRAAPVCGFTANAPAPRNGSCTGSSDERPSVRLHEAPEYAELHCLSNFSFLRGASHAEELVVQAKELGYAALAITDECSLAGVVRAHSAVKKIGGIKLLIGAEFALDCGLRLVVIARNRAGYGRLSRLITRGRRCGRRAATRSRAPMSRNSSVMPHARARPCVARWRCGCRRSAPAAAGAGRMDGPHFRRSRLDRGGAHA